MGQEASRKETMGENGSFRRFEVNHDPSQLGDLFPQPGFQAFAKIVSLLNRKLRAQGAMERGCPSVSLFPDGGVVTGAIAHQGVHQSHHLLFHLGLILLDQWPPDAGGIADGFDVSRDLSDFRHGLLDAILQD
jgi:hypothetical protein